MMLMFQGGISMKNLESLEQVFKSNDSILVKDADSNFVLKICKLYLISLSNTSMLICKGGRFDFIRGVNGESETNFWTGFSHIPLNPNCIGYFIQTDHILRKVMLVIIGGSMIVAEYQQKQADLHFKVIVPPLIEVGDMLLVQGEQQGGIWHTKVLDIIASRKSAVVVFFTQSKNDETVFIRETQG